MSLEDAIQKAGNTSGTRSGFHFVPSKLKAPTINATNWTTQRSILGDSNQLRRTMARTISLDWKKREHESKHVPSAWQNTRDP